MITFCLTNYSDACVTFCVGLGRIIIILQIFSWVFINFEGVSISPLKNCYVRFYRWWVSQIVSSSRVNKSLLRHFSLLNSWETASLYFCKFDRTAGSVVENTNLLLFSVSYWYLSGVLFYVTGKNPVSNIYRLYIRSLSFLPH